MTNDFLMLILIVLVFLKIVVDIFASIRASKTNKDITTKENEFTTAMSALNAIVEAHTSTIFDEEISRIRSNFDLKKESKTNSKKSFHQEFDNLCTKTTKTIIKTYISESLLKSLLKYYKIEGLTLFILSILRKR